MSKTLDRGLTTATYLSMTDHINKACNAAFYHLHNLRRIKKFLSRDSLITLVHAFITSRLDYNCNGLLFGLPKAQIAKLQRVQNAAARLILGIGKFSHITPALWLPVSLRIDYQPRSQVLSPFSPFLDYEDKGGKGERAWERG